MKRSDLFLYFKATWASMSVACIGFAIFAQENVLQFLAMAGVAVLWAILMKMEERE